MSKKNYKYVPCVKYGDNSGWEMNFPLCKKHGIISWNIKRNMIQVMMLYS